MPSHLLAIGRYSHVVVPFAFRRLLIPLFHRLFKFVSLYRIPCFLKLLVRVYFVASCQTDYSLGSCIGFQIFLFIILRHTGCCRADIYMHSLWPWCGVLARQERFQRDNASIWGRHEARTEYSDSWYRIYKHFLQFTRQVYTTSNRARSVSRL